MASGYGSLSRFAVQSLPVPVSIPHPLSIDALPPLSGVYAIEHLPSGTKYIGLAAAAVSKPTVA